jgi:hypothetical protein
MEIAVVDNSSEIALKNAEFNERRIKSSGRTSGSLKVTDPAALARLMAEMRARTEQQR